MDMFHFARNQTGQVIALLETYENFEHLGNWENGFRFALTA